MNILWLGELAPLSSLPLCDSLSLSFESDSTQLSPEPKIPIPISDLSTGVTNRTHGFVSHAALKCGSNVQGLGPLQSILPATASRWGNFEISRQVVAAVAARAAMTDSEEREGAEAAWEFLCDFGSAQIQTKEVRSVLLNFILS